jgi:hypothetical protein
MILSFLLVAALAFLAGLIVGNIMAKRQRYTAEDMLSFADMVSVYDCDPKTGEYYLTGTKILGNLQLKKIL